MFEKIFRKRAYLIHRTEAFGFKKNTFQRGVYDATTFLKLENTYSSFKDAFASINDHRYNLVVELEYDDKFFHTSEYLENIEIIAIHFSGCIIPWKKINLTKCEAAHIQALKYQPDNTNYLRLTEDPLQYLSRIPTQLLFLLFIDYKFFDFACENWQRYDATETHCVDDLFSVATDTLIQNPNKSKLSLDDLKLRHAKIAKNSYHATKNDSQPGMLRDIYNSFPLFADTVTQEGIRELLLRIKSDNNKLGFMLGEMPKFDITATFAEKVYGYLLSIGLNSTSVSHLKKTNDLDTFAAVKNQAINDIYNSLGKTYPDISEQDIAQVVEDSLRDYNVIECLQQHIKFSPVHNFRFAIKELKNGKSDYALQHAYARKHALASAGDKDAPADISHYSPEEIDNLAATIYQQIINGKKEIFILTPEPKLAEQWACNAIEKYNTAIISTDAEVEKLTIIINFLQEIERLHIFIDCNCRVCYSFLDELSINNKIKKSILYNPNCMDAFDSKSFLEEVKKGIWRVDYIVNNAKELLEKNKRIQDFFTTHIAPQFENQSNPYEEISKALTDLLSRYVEKQDVSLDDESRSHCTLS